MENKINRVIVEYLKKYDPEQIGVFGSYARQEMTAESDIDILYSFQKKISLFDIVQIKLDLEEKLHRKIDLVSKAGLKPWIIPEVMKDLKIIYEK